jgi:hypothetical protein
MPKLPVTQQRIDRVLPSPQLRGRAQVLWKLAFDMAAQDHGADR